MATIDISIEIKNGMVHWPDNPPVSIKRILDLKRKDSCTLSLISMGSHTGTHMDAPVHFLKNGQGIDKMPLDAVLGKARVIEIKDPEAIKVKELIKYKIRSGERILFKTRNSKQCWKTNSFIKNFVYISKEAAQFLGKLKVKTVGIDYLSVGGYAKNGVEIHRTLISSKIWIIEGLNLSKVKPGRYDLICLPLKILDGDGSPARAILKTTS
ncbi:MAG: arylformamidase [Elusimicrobia bacterium RIFCSPLOWO2_02_FULL_39_32]|nr:MAG: arylformamidase [Elusimicrobia bacterium RIFCSPHIGHO2_02_FULL_39_36]OGR93636.1 MAG: arylformamidase [Elusimicrobia bacterium RIFCSPLOWO2_02_FULL_39_32]OGS00458.1 MAG: arylformamidase [Elusimicrobia bacterium RIFCSPLOWO2_12_FULL_39_28]